MNIKNILCITLWYVSVTQLHAMHSHDFSKKAQWAIAHGMIEYELHKLLLPYYVIDDIIEYAKSLPNLKNKQRRRILQSITPSHITIESIPRSSSAIFYDSQGNICLDIVKIDPYDRLSHTATHQYDYQQKIWNKQPPRIHDSHKKRSEGSCDNTKRLFESLANTDSSFVIEQLGIPVTPFVHIVAYDPSHTLIACKYKCRRHPKQAILLLNADTFELANTLPPTPTTAFAFSHDGQQLARLQAKKDTVEPHITLWDLSQLAMIMKRLTSWNTRDFTIKQCNMLSALRSPSDTAHYLQWIIKSPSHGKRVHENN